MIRVAKDTFAAQGLPEDPRFFDAFDFAHGTAP